MEPIAKIQLGKQGVTDNFISTLRSHFKKSKTVKVSVLKSCCRDKKELKELSNKILEKLGKNYTSRAIGYTLAIKKWRRDKIGERKN